MVLLCSVSAISAASDNAVDNLTSEIGTLDDSISVSNGENTGNDILQNQRDTDNEILGEDSTNESASDEGYVIYVGTHNKTETGNGSYENPFSTLKLACDSVSGENKTVINIFNGTYLVGSELKFDTNNLFINGLGEVIIKNELTGPKDKQAIELTSSIANCTFNNIIFDGSEITRFTNNGFFSSFYGSANLVEYNNCSFIGGKKMKLIGSSEFNLRLINCVIENFNNQFLFKSDLYNGDSPKSTDYRFVYFENCIFLRNTLTRIAQFMVDNKNVSMNGAWFGENNIPDYLLGIRVYNHTNSKSLDPQDMPITKYAIFSAQENYLGNNTHEIIGKLCWNGTNDTVGNAFSPMTVTLTSATGDIQTNATLENGVFRAVYTSNSSDNLVTATLDYETINLNFINVEFQVDAPSILYGQDQNITITLSQATNSTLNVTVNNKTYEVKVNDSTSVTFTVPDVLKEGTYIVEVLLNDNENHIYGSNSTELVVSKVSAYDFDVVTSSEVKVGENATITITLPDDVNGTVIIEFGNETKRLSANQTIVAEFSNLKAITYYINVTYTGNDKYISKSFTDSLTVGKADSKIEIEDAVFNYGEIISIPFNITNAKGITVIVLNRNDEEVATASSESGIINLNTLTAGKYTLEATTVVDTNNYEWDSKTINLTINKANSSLDIQDKGFEYAAEAVITAVCENSTGDVIATLTDESNTEIAVKVSGDNITLPKLNTGKYTLTVTTNTDENHTNVTKSATITIIKTTPSINVTVKPAENITAKDNVTLTINLPSDATGEVNVKINGKKTDTISANETITINLNNQVGDYFVDITYSGDKNYESDSTIEEFTISKAEILITAKQIDFEEGNASKIEVTIPDVDSGIVLVDVSGKKFYGDINNGKATVTLDGLSKGNYTANIKFFGDEKYNEATCTADVKVSEAKIITELKEQLEEAQANATSLANDLADANAKVDNLTADLADANGKVDNLTADLADAQANATSLANDLADANGKVDNLTAQLIEAEKQIETLSAELIPTTIAANNLKIKALTNGNIKVTLKANGTALANKTVNVILNGVVYNGTTGEDGVAKIVVKFASAGTYYATVTFAGDDTYKSSISTSKVVVSKKATKIIAPTKKFKAKTKIKKVKITLKSGSKVLKSKKITLKVKGKTYTAKTNSKGVATIKVTKLTKIGTFTYTVKFAGDKAYKGIIKKGKMTIN